MIKTAPHSTLSTQMWCIRTKNKRMVCTHPDLLARIFFPRFIYCDQEPLLLLNVTEDYFLGVQIGLH